jgi:hypothetical protein
MDILIIHNYSIFINSHNFFIRICILKHFKGIKLINNKIMTPFKKNIMKHKIIRGKYKLIKENKIL